MGYGAQMRVYNTTSQPATLKIDNVNCFFEGQEGSSLQVFNNQTVPPGGAFPTGGRQYIERINTFGSSCFDNPSTFNLTVNGNTAQFTANEGNYVATGYAGIAVTVNNNDPQAYIDVVLYQP